MTHHWKKPYSHGTVLILYEHKSKMTLANNTNIVIVIRPMSTTQGDVGVGGRVSGLCEGGSSSQGAARSASLGIITTIAIARAVHVLRPLYFLQSTRAPGTAAQCFWGEPQTWGAKSRLHPKEKQPTQRPAWAPL